MGRNRKYRTNIGPKSAFDISLRFPSQDRVVSISSMEPAEFQSRFPDFSGRVALGRIIDRIEPRCVN